MVNIHMYRPRMWYLKSLFLLIFLGAQWIFATASNDLNIDGSEAKVRRTITQMNSRNLFTKEIVDLEKNIQSKCRTRIFSSRWSF